MSLLSDFDSTEGSRGDGGRQAKSILDDFDRTVGSKGNEKDKAIPGNETNYKPEAASKKLSGPVKTLLNFHGTAETAAALTSGAIAAPIAAAAGVIKGFTGGKYGTPEGAREAQQYAGEVAQSLTYQPRGQIAQENLSAVGKAIDSSKLAGLGPTEGISLAGVAATPARIPKAVPQPQAAMNAPKFASAGAAAAGTVEQATALAARASPEIQQAVTKAGKQINMEALERHVQADSLPVPIKLSKGQSTQDPVTISHEMNLRGKHEDVARKYNDQNSRLIENTNAIRESAAPDVFTASKPAHGEAIIEAYRSKDAALNKDISAKYKALNDANGGQFPLDGKAFVASAEEALHKELLYDHIPDAMKKTLERIGKDGKMTFENFESLRTNLARVQRSNPDGNQKAAASAIRDALEQLPMPAGAEHLKPLADAARQSAKERFDLIKADPAYKAVVRGTASADRFVEKYVVGGDLKHVQTMKQNLAHDPVAQQTMSAGTIDQLKDSARIIDNQGNFSQAGYNKALEKIRPKLDVLFGPEHKKQLEDLGDVARYTQIQPRGSFVNNSNTMTAAMAEHGKTAAEGAANVAAGGVPVGTWARKIGGKYMEHREINESFQPAAGIKLKDVGR